MDTTTVYGNRGWRLSGEREHGVAGAQQLCDGYGYAEHERRAVDGSDGYGRHDHGRRAHTGASVTLTGTAAAIDTALASATYTGGGNYYGPDTLTVDDHRMAVTTASFSTSGGDHG